MKRWPLLSGLFAFTFNLVRAFRAPVLVLLFAPALASAQTFDLLELRSEYLPPTALDGARPAGRTPWSSADDVQLSTYAAAVNVPLPLGDSTLLVPGVGYRLDSLSFSHESPAERELGLHAFEVPVTLVLLLSSDWMLLFQVSPALASDLDDVDDRALRMGGLALASHAFSDRFTLGAGGAAMLEFGSLLPVPVLYLKWEPAARVSVDAVLPVLMDAKLTLGDRFELGVRADVEGNSYAISDSSVRGAWPCVAETDDPTTTDDEAQPDRAQCIDHVGYSVATAGAAFGVRIVESFWLTLYVGHTFFRRFEQMNDDNERVEGGMQTLPDVFFARVGLTWRMPEDSEQSSPPQHQGSAESPTEAP